MESVVVSVNFRTCCSA